MSLPHPAGYSTPWLHVLTDREQIRLLTRECHILDAQRHDNAKQIVLRERLIKAARHRLDQSVLKNP